MPQGMTKREFLQSVGVIAGAAAVYRSMTALGMMGPSTAHANTLDLPVGSGRGKRVAILEGGSAAWWRPMNCPKRAISARFWRPPPALAGGTSRPGAAM